MEIVLTFCAFLVMIVVPLVILRALAEKAHRDDIARRRARLKGMCQALERAVKTPHDFSRRPE